MEEKKTKLFSIDELIEEAEKYNAIIVSELNEPNFKLMAEAAINYYIDLDF